MAYLQQATPPPNKRMTFSLKSFTGGMNNRSDLLKDNEAYDTLNMMFTKSENAMEKRKGFKIADKLQYVDNAMFTFIDLYRPYHEEDIFLYVPAPDTKDDDTYTPIIHGYRFRDGEYPEPVSLFSGLENPEKISGTNFQGKYFFVNGSKLYCIGRFPIESKTPYVKVVRAPISPEFGDVVDGQMLEVFEVVSPPLDAERLDTSHAQGVMNYDFVGRTCWYTPCENEFVDPLLGANVIPEGARFITSHNGRMFMSGAEKDDDNVFITHVQNPFYFPVTLPLQVPPNSDEITGLAVFDDSVIVSRKNDMHAIRGMTNNPELGFDLFRLFRINAHTGFASNNAVDIAHNYLFYLGYDGNAYAMSSVQEGNHLLQTAIISNQLDLRSAPFNDIAKEDIIDAKSHFVNDMWYVQIGKHTLVYSYIHRAWTRYLGLNITCFDKSDNTRLRWSGMFEKTYVGETYRSGGFYEFGDEYLDEPIVIIESETASMRKRAKFPYVAYWQSKRFDMDDASNFKQFKEFFIVSHTYDRFISDVLVSFQVDHTEVKNRLSVETRISRFGRAVFGDKFITRNVNSSLPVVVGRRGRNVQFILQNGEEVEEIHESYVEMTRRAKRIEGRLIYTGLENKYYRYIEGNWVEVETEQLNQPMLVYQVNGEYELRGKR